jgi:hypothetical protein
VFIDSAVIDKKVVGVFVRFCVRVISRDCNYQRPANLEISKIVDLPVTFNFTTYISVRAEGW